MYKSGQLASPSRRTGAGGCTVHAPHCYVDTVTRNASIRGRWRSKKEQTTPLIIPPSQKRCWRCAPSCCVTAFHGDDGDEDYAVSPMRETRLMMQCARGQRRGRQNSAADCDDELWGICAGTLEDVAAQINASLRKRGYGNLQQCICGVLQVCLRWLVMLHVALHWATGLFSTRRRTWRCDTSRHCLNCHRVALRSQWRSRRSICSSRASGRRNFYTSLMPVRSQSPPLWPSRAC